LHPPAFATAVDGKADITGTEKMCQEEAIVQGAAISHFEPFPVIWRVPQFENRGDGIAVNYDP